MDKQTKSILDMFDEKMLSKSYTERASFLRTISYPEFGLRDFVEGISKNEKEMLCEKILELLYTDINDHVRYYAADALGKMGNKGLVDKLNKKLDFSRMNEFYFAINTREYSESEIKRKVEQSVIEILNREEN